MLSTKESINVKSLPFKYGRTGDGKPTLTLQADAKKLAPLDGVKLNEIKEALDEEGIPYAPAYWAEKDPEGAMGRRLDTIKIEGEEAVKALAKLGNYGAKLCLEQCRITTESRQR